MKTLALSALALITAASLGVAATSRQPVPLTTRSCCEDCNVARYRPENVPVVPPSMVPGALLLESLVAGAALLALGLVQVRRPRRAPRGEAAEV